MSITVWLGLNDVIVVDLFGKTGGGTFVRR
jgi:hypothetical protein